MCYSYKTNYRVFQKMTRFKIIISNNENVLQLQNKLQSV